MFGRKPKVQVRLVPMPIREGENYDGTLVKVKELLENKDLQNFFRQRIAMASHQIPIYTEAGKKDMVQMLAGAIKELGYLVEFGSADIDQFMTDNSKEDIDPRQVARENFSNIVREDVADGG